MVSEDQLNKLMDLVKIPIKKRNFDELHDQIQNLIEENDSFKSYFLSKHDNTLEKILNIPGLQHLAENIFGNLNFQYLKICRGINKSSKQILDNQMDKPMFLLRTSIFCGLSKKNQRDWIKVIQSVKNSEKEKPISAYLIWNLKQKDSVLYIPLLHYCLVDDLPCYTSPPVQDAFRKTIKRICQKWRLSNEDMKMVKILVPLTDNPNAAENIDIGWTPIHSAARNGHIEIVKLLIPYSEVPNSFTKGGNTPRNLALENNHHDIADLLE